MILSHFHSVAKAALHVLLVWSLTNIPNLCIHIVSKILGVFSNIKQNYGQGK